MEQGARYFDDERALGCFDVVFIVRESGVKLVKEFSSPYLASKFVNRMRRSKKCILVSYPQAM